MRFWRPFALALALIGSVGVGCKTADTADSGDQASVLISGHSEDEIRQAAATVFIGNQFQAAPSAVRELVFERKASHSSNFLYGGWLGADEGLWERVKLTFLPKGDDTFVVGLNAYLVAYHGQGFFEEEKKRSRVHRSSYGKLLQAIQEKLNIPFGDQAPGASQIRGTH